ncbi:MAG: magnesium transporter [Clostridia bacterium]|nr:magnesium transporter [Clostridia bacterium]
MDKDFLEEKDYESYEIPDYDEEIAVIIRGNEPDDVIREKLDDYHDKDIAEALESLTATERRRIYRILGVEKVSDIFAYLDDVGTYFEELRLEAVADIIENMDADDAVDALEDIDDAEVREQLIELIDEDAMHDINLIRSFDEDEIGSVMTTNFVAIGRGLTIRQAMKSLIAQAEDNDNISTLYVIDDDDRFYGAIDLKELIIARDFMELESLISTSYPYFYAHEQIADCVVRLKEYAEDSIPVLDDEDRILGVITAHDVVEVVDEEIGEDYAKLAGLTEQEDLDETLLESIKNRMPWLLALLVLGLLVSSVVGIFENVVSQVSLIVCFQSLILGMSGNVGTQSLAVTIRVLMDDEITARQTRGLIWKEMRVGLTNGLMLGVLSTAFIGLYIWLLKGRELYYAFAVSGCAGIAIAVALTISSIMGTVIPLCLHKLKIDPAVASGPLISTINDLVGVVSYYGLSWLLLINMLGLVG